MEISRVKFHVLLTYNYDDKDAKRLLRMHKSILCGATQINLKVHISNVYNMHLFKTSLKIFKHYKLKPNFLIFKDNKN